MNWPVQAETAPFKLSWSIIHTSTQRLTQRFPRTFSEVFSLDLGNQLSLYLSLFSGPFHKGLPNIKVYQIPKSPDLGKDFREYKTEEEFEKAVNNGSALNESEELSDFYFISGQMLEVNRRVSFSIKKEPSRQRRKAPKKKTQDAEKPLTFSTTESPDSENTTPPWNP